MPVGGGDEGGGQEEQAHGGYAQIQALHTTRLSGEINAYPFY